MARPATTGPDLFTVTALAEAERAAVAAEAARAEAQRKYRVAPHGELKARLSTLQEAAQEALRADIAWQRAKAEVGL
ncbi:hypothetical protein GVN21_16785 [Caulobacter sp. SLTY]|uniref:hypothetical protein n=1 Tax=Caulobacter sp. SLTY TaxID=2683262 RepID=UPI001412A81E|nr:hypothetical protein [Caulobacter sp. SLTY]NBB17024.1 hypothetical protein [Caulobacter sp. SLTY]